MLDVSVYEMRFIRAAERPPPPDPSDFEFILEQPNKYLVLMEFFKNPDKIAQYMSTNCEPRLVDFYDGGGYGRWSASIYVNTSESALAQEDVLEVCADNFGAWEEYHLYASHPSLHLSAMRSCAKMIELVAILRF